MLVHTVIVLIQHGMSVLGGGRRGYGIASLK